MSTTCKTPSPLPTRRNRLKIGLVALGLATSASLLGPLAPVAAESSDGRAQSQISDHQISDQQVGSVALGTLAKMPRPRPPAPFPGPGDLVPNNCGIVPDVIGMTQEEAIATIEAASPLFWAYVDFGWVPEGQAEIGTVFFQSQAPKSLLFDCGEKSAAGMITITVVAGYIP